MAGSHGHQYNQVSKLAIAVIIIFFIVVIIIIIEPALLIIMEQGPPRLWLGWRMGKHWVSSILSCCLSLS